MTDKLTPVRCGCGGEAYHEAYENYNFGSYIAHIMICDKCGMRTAEWPSEAEAVTAWNRAMGAKDINVPNKTAKVENISDYRLPINDYCFIKKGDCGNCGFTATEGDKYCRECGARFEWE